MGKEFFLHSYSIIKDHYVTATKGEGGGNKTLAAKILLRATKTICRRSLNRCFRKGILATKLPGLLNYASMDKCNRQLEIWKQRLYIHIFIYIYMYNIYIYIYIHIYLYIYVYMYI